MRVAANAEGVGEREIQRADDGSSRQVADADNRGQPAEGARQLLLHRFRLRPDALRLDLELHHVQSRRLLGFQ